VNITHLGKINEDIKSGIKIEKNFIKVAFFCGEIFFLRIKVRKLCGKKIRDVRKLLLITIEFVNSCESCMKFSTIH